MRKERDFQQRLIAEIKMRFDGCMVLKTDSNYIQGLPDLLLLWNDKWAALECKRSIDSPHRPNQDHYISKLNGMSFAAFVSPENMEVVLDDIQSAFGS